MPRHRTSILQEFYQYSILHRREKCNNNSMSYWLQVALKIELLLYHTECSCTSSLRGLYIENECETLMNKVVGETTIIFIL